VRADNGNATNRYVTCSSFFLTRRGYLQAIWNGTDEHFVSKHPPAFVECRFTGGFNMPLHPQAKELLRQLAALGLPPLSEQTPQEARLRTRLPVHPEPIAFTADQTIPGPGGDIPIRIYRPEGEAPFPVLLYFHGGGWVINSINSHDPTCRALANTAHCIVISVEYRLAPEHKYPAAAEDAYATTLWAAKYADQFGGDPNRLAVSGDSAGGNLAAVVALMARDQGGPSLCCQLLVYPATNYNFDTASYLENATGYGLTRDSMIWFWEHYLPDPQSGLQPYASPLLANLEGLPAAFVITAEYDPLRDEGEAYAKRLQDSGIETLYKCYPGMTHMFFTNSHMLDTGKEAIGDAARFLNAHFAK
jgi:acetyl esterase